MFTSVIGNIVIDPGSLRRVPFALVCFSCLIDCIVRNHFPDMISINSFNFILNLAKYRRTRRTGRKSMLRSIIFQCTIRGHRNSNVMIVVVLTAYLAQYEFKTISWRFIPIVKVLCCLKSSLNPQIAVLKGCCRYFSCSILRNVNLNFIG